MLRAVFLILLLSVALPGHAAEPLTVEEARAEEITELGRMALRDHNFKAARYHFEQAHALGSAVALANLGLMHRAGQGVPQDIEKGNGMLREAGSSGVARIMYLFGEELLEPAYHYWRAIDRQEQKKRWREASEAGDENAARRLERVRELPIPEQPPAEETAEAINLLEEASERGHAKAMLTLAWVYEHGIGVPVDLGRAEMLLRSAIDLGYLGFARAPTWLADDPGHETLMVSYDGYLSTRTENAKVSLADFYVRATQNYSKAVGLYTEAADNGDSAAMLGLARLYRDGLGVPQGLDKAASLSLKAQDVDNRDLAWVQRNGRRSRLLRGIDRHSEDYIRAMKRALLRSGHYDGEIDGNVDDEFKRALVLYPDFKRQFDVDSIYEDFGDPYLKAFVDSLVSTENMLQRHEKRRGSPSNNQEDSNEAQKDGKSLDQISSIDDDVHERLRREHQETLSMINKHREKLGLK